MSKQFRFRRLFEKEHSKRAQTLMKSERQHLYHIYWSVWRKFTSKKFLLLICKIFRLFLDKLTANDKLSLLNGDNSCNEFRCSFLKNKKLFLNFYLNFSNILWIFNIFRKNITLIADVFPILRTLKNSPISEDPSKSNIVNGTKRCWNLNDSSFAMFIDQWENIFCCKKLLLVICKSSWGFVFTYDCRWQVFCSY